MFQFIGLVSVTDSTCKYTLDVDTVYLNTLTMSVPLLLVNHFRSFPHQVASVSFLQFNFDGEDTSDMRFRHITEMTILTVQLIVEFSKQLPGFGTLQREDQITLLKVHSPAYENGGLMSNFLSGKLTSYFLLGRFLGFCVPRTSGLHVPRDLT